MHGLLEVDGVQHFNAVWLINDLPMLVLRGFSMFVQLGCTP